MTTYKLSQKGCQVFSFSFSLSLSSFLSLLCRQATCNKIQYLSFLQRLEISFSYVVPSFKESFREYLCCPATKDYCSNIQSLDFSDSKPFHVVLLWIIVELFCYDSTISDPEKVSTIILYHSTRREKKTTPITYFRHNVKYYLSM